MTVIEVNKKDLLNLVGKNLSDQELGDTLFLLKCETVVSNDDIEIELNPDRPDMLSVEGVARALKSYLNIETGLKKYGVASGNHKLTAEDVRARPSIACSVIKNVNLTDELVASLMQIQEKLHLTLGRQRKKVAIGIHDFDKIEGPFLYKEVDPNKVKFVPLDETKEMNLGEILNKHPKGKDYAHLLMKYSKYPIIFDKNKNVISFPPIINGELTKVTKKTKNLFIDVTGTDEDAVSSVLNILVCNITERGGEIESVFVNEKEFPDLTPKTIKVSTNNLNNLLGLGIDEKDLHTLLGRMGYDVMDIKGQEFHILIPPYRFDILHEVDIIEDIAIAYGYNNIEPIIPKIATMGDLTEETVFTNKVRDLLVGLGFQEYVGYILTNKNKQFYLMNTFEEPVVELENFVSSEYDVCRKHLLPSLMGFLASNKHEPYPQNIFEAGNCVVLDKDEPESGTRTIKKVAAVVSKDDVNLTEIKSLMESVLRNIGISDYEIRPYKHPSFIETRCGVVVANGERLGIFGEFHPEALTNWQLDRAVAGFELNLDIIKKLSHPTE